MRTRAWISPSNHQSFELIDEDHSHRLFSPLALIVAIVALLVFLKGYG